MTWVVRLGASARKQLDAVHEPDLSRLRRKILALERNPRPHGSVRLKNSPYQRARAGDWRIVYLVDDAAREVLVVQVLRRSEKTYRRLS